MKIGTVKIAREDVLPRALIEQRVAEMTELATRNRNRGADCTLGLITDDPEQFIQKVKSVSPARVRGALGFCGGSSNISYVYVKTERDTHECDNTLVHELTHAACAKGISHDYSFRRLYTMAWAVAHPEAALMEVRAEAFSITHRYTAPRAPGWYPAAGYHTHDAWGHAATDWYEGEEWEEYMNRIWREVGKIMTAVEKIR
jgi:hypothetical protein